MHTGNANITATFIVQAPSRPSCIQDLKKRNKRDGGPHREVKMLSPRPASASRAPTMEKELLEKIGLLAEHHARNVQALHRLRRSAWTAGDQVRKTGVSKDDSMLFCTRPAGSRRTFTRVAVSAGSTWRHTPTVVEPFRSMETHTTAWKRKIRKNDEVSSTHCAKILGIFKVYLSMYVLALPLTGEFSHSINFIGSENYDKPYFQTFSRLADVSSSYPAPGRTCCSRG